MVLAAKLCVAPEQPPPAPPASQPIAPPKPTRKSPGATDGNYFVNCQTADGRYSSGVAYYKNLSPGSNNGHQPDDYVDAVHGPFVKWETSSSGEHILLQCANHANEGVVKLSNTGTVVTWNILGDVENAAKDESVGTSSNGYKSFWVYRGGGDLLYTVDRWQCYNVCWGF